MRWCTAADVASANPLAVDVAGEPQHLPVLTRLIERVGTGLAERVAPLAALAVALNQIVADPGNSVLGLLLVLAGLPVYYFTVKRSTGVARARD